VEKQVLSELGFRHFSRIVSVRGLDGDFRCPCRQDRRSVLPNDHLKNTPATLRVGPSDERCSCSTPLQLLEQRPPVADEDSLAGESR